MLRLLLLTCVIFLTGCISTSKETILLSRVNAEVNQQVEYRSDFVSYKQEDYWQKPSLTYKRKAGDCEDYAVLKGKVLREAGYTKSLEIVLAADRLRPVNHAVLLANSHYVLDNKEDELQTLAEFKERYRVLMRFPIERLDTIFNWNEFK